MSENAFGAISGINPDGTANFGDGNVFVTFFRGSRLHRARSEAAGTPTYDAVDMIKIIKPGERDEIHRIAEEFDKRRYARQWEAYKQQIELAVSGTPLATLLPANPEVVDGLRALKVTTVQQLAELPDSAIGGIQFGFDLRRKAQRYLAVAEKGEEYHKLEKALSDNAALVADLKARLDAAEAKLLAAATPSNTSPASAAQAPSPSAPAEAGDVPHPPALSWDGDEDEFQPVTRPRRKG